MIYIIIKTVLTAAVIVGVSEIGKRHTAFAAMLAALPLWFSSMMKGAPDSFVPSWPGIPDWPPPPPLIGALLRVPANTILRRLIADLNASGFEELRLPHMAVLQYPGPDGVSPGTLAERAGISKQAMNQLLRSLETLGYLVRADAPEAGRARIVRLTKRGRAAYATIHDILRDIEHEWRAELGPAPFTQLKKLLHRVWTSPLTR